MSDLRLIKPYLSFDEVEQDFREVFDSGMFTRGKHVAAFRRELCAYTGAKHAYLSTSATTALWMCMKLLGVGPGDEVIVSDFSWPATANVVEDLGARPVFADVSPDTFNMLADQLKQKITPRTRAVIFVDALGNPTGLTEIQAICKRHDLPLVEDAACAAGSSEFGRRCGAIADITCFSFHPRKLVNTGEGGAILTGRDDWSQWLEVKLGAGVGGMKGPAANFVDYGYNFRLPEMAAAMGRRQLAKLDAIVDERIAMRDHFVAGLAALGFMVQQCGDQVRHNVQSLAFRVPQGCNRDALIEQLKAAGIESTIGTYALSATTYYAGRYNEVQSNSKRLFETTLTLPCYHGLDVQRVLDAIAAAPALKP